ncbi:BolA/IbaG family iron-sulfur metabolism protein [Enterobacteriaceae endosymbiont of Donacia versicolorea]|uniref:BolA family protein n=1 Tax=Enterobacteriaceae endosymbiont of Donacia versicolorea TaxID=2675788 RepID=UPI001448A59B|nr:BolA family protein [Enterobacteriaceae endosymbiont of Donacia versicolorea]QJC32078.1 BolA/IbaG family iron-sulfur metabolism protein [Enterobacteriaceae endosymbiont of Donacia versicolorea]
MIIEKIKNKIKCKLNPIYLKINNNSNNNDVTDLITHLEIIIVSDFFIKKKLIDRHRLIYHIIKDILKNIHSLSLYTYTLNEWKNNKNI